MRRISLDWRTTVGVAAGILSLGLIVGFLETSSGVLTRVGIGALLALAFEPAVNRAQRALGGRRGMAVGVVAGGFVVIASGLLAVVGPPAIRQAQEVGGELPQTVRDFYDVPIIGDWLEEREADQRVEEWAEDLPRRFDLDQARDAARTVGGGVANTVWVLLIGFTLLLDGPRLVARARRIIPPDHRPRADEVARMFHSVVGTYFAGSVTVAIIGGTWVLVVGLALGVPLAPIAAVWYAMVSLIPQIGGFLGTSFVVILALSQGPFVALATLVLVVGYMNLENYVITPAIVGQAVDLSPPTTMLAALVGGAALGVPGALVATPLVGTVKAIYLRYRFGEQPFERVPLVERLPGPLRRLVRRLRPSGDSGDST